MRINLFSLVFTIVFVFSGQACAGAENKVALLIGNASYKKNTPLVNAINDVDLIGDALKAAGFQSVVIVKDVTRSDLLAALRSFDATASEADIAVVYYAGHGIEINGNNYLVPIDAGLLSDKDVEDEAISLRRVQAATNGAKRMRLIILDACRIDPFTASMKRSISTRSVNRGLARVEPEGSNEIIAYAAKAGTVAQDGGGKNSPFAMALAKYITVPELDIRIALGKVRDDVVGDTNGEQEPSIYGSLGGTTISLGGSQLPSKSGSEAATEAPAGVTIDPAKLHDYLLKNPEAITAVQAAIEKKKKRSLVLRLRP